MCILTPVQVILSKLLSLHTNMMEEIEVYICTSRLMLISWSTVSLVKAIALSGQQEVSTVMLLWKLGYLRKFKDWNWPEGSKSDRIDMNVVCAPLS